MKKALIVGIILSCFLISLLPQGNVNTTNKQWKLEYIEHEPITIDSDDDFVALGFNGSGTAEDPYVIQQLKITAVLGSCISISDTTVYFIIRYCYLEGGLTSIGIHDITAGTAIITNNTCNGGDIWIEHSSYITIANNTCINVPMGSGIVAVSYTHLTLPTKA